MSVLSSSSPFLGLKDIIKRVEAAQAKIKANNETRYQAIIDKLQGQGEASKRENLRSGLEERGANLIDSISRGIGQTGVVNAFNERSRERVQRLNNAVDESVADRVAGVMERRTDEYPDLNLYAQLARDAAEGSAQNVRSHSVIGGSPRSNAVLSAGRSGGAGGGGGSGGAAGGFGYPGGGGGGGAARVMTKVNANPSGYWGSSSTPAGWRGGAPGSAYFQLGAGGTAVSPSGKMTIKGVKRR